MKKGQAIKVFVFIMLVTILNSFSSAWAINGNAIARNGVNGATVTEYKYIEEHGKVVIIGETNRDLIKIRKVINNKEIWYDVKLVNNRFKQEIWLSEGIGNYRFDILVHEFDRKYRLGPQVKIQSTKKINPFLVPNKHIESNNDDIINLAILITKQKETDYEKAKAIYEWIVNEISYDFTKLSNHQVGNYNNNYGALNTLKTKKGVCYDYAALYAALGRAINLETKLVTGLYKGTHFNGYHAWNEVYITEENRWLTLDATFGKTTETNHFDISNLNDYTKQSEK